MLDRKRYVIWGSGGHAKVLASVIDRLSGEVAALFDNDPAASPCIGGVALHIGVTGFERWSRSIAPKDFFGLVAIGGCRGRDRLRIAELFVAAGVAVEPLIHPEASVCRSARIGPGSQVFPRALVAAEAEVGRVCILNHNANVDHECRLGDGVHIAPGGTLCGCVNLGNNVMIGAGAIVLPHIKIGEDTIVGAGAVVTRNLPNGVVAVGNPARIVRKARSP
jgi:sugar O-acyltransferase (sialic acid O-acetyltransferase NeuD family)